MNRDMFNDKNNNYIQESTQEQEYMSIFSPQKLHNALFDTVSDVSTDSDDNQNPEAVIREFKDISINQNSDKKNKMKSSLCRNFSEKGYCPYGLKCQFAHGLVELRCNVSQNSYKTKPCNSFWKKDCCPYGFRCNFSHSVRPTGEGESVETPLKIGVDFRELSQRPGKQSQLLLLLLK